MLNRSSFAAAASSAAASSSEADDGEGVAPAHLRAQQAFVRGAEPAGDAGSVEERDEVGQHDAVAFLGQDEVGVTAVALPAVGGPAG